MRLGKTIRNGKKGIATDILLPHPLPLFEHARRLACRFFKSGGKRGRAVETAHLAHIENTMPLR